ncbi:MAG: hypothetical protein UX18_C0038G0012, partial [Candidatus Azambacteria bacterium GW2011_GWC2_45_7b]
MATWTARGVLLLLLGGLALGQPTGEAEARDGDIVVAQKADVDTFDPAMSTATSSHVVTINIFDTLIRLSD